MKCAESNVVEATEPARENILRFPTGLLGFEHVKEYMLLASPDEAPFAWLQTMREPNLAFLVIPPTYVTDSYRPDVSAEDVQALDLQSSEDALVLNIVTLHPDGRATVNLKGPIVINRRTRTAKQVVPLNVAEFELHHPLKVAQT